MKTFVFRNNTIEPFFPATGFTFSGYDDISAVPAEATNFLWFYQVPLAADSAVIAREVLGYIDRLRLVAQQVTDGKRLAIMTLVNPFTSKTIESNCAVDEAVGDFNSAARELAEGQNNVVVLDISKFCNRYSQAELIDWKYWFISQMPFNPKLAKPFKQWYEGKVRGLEMKRKKCLVLDLDNTLWGGILGEDGVEGIKVGGDYPGKAFAWWQKALLGLSKAGVILTVCSKNNESDVKEAWEKNPFLILKEEHFSAYRINWQDKATNVQELAKELNIGLDSMVFVDDNPTEREIIRQMLPMVAVPGFPAQPYELPTFFNRLVDDYFQLYALTDEDRKKTEQYKANADRAKAQRTFANFDDFLRSLEIHITIDRANDFNIPRIAQMTQKTNQFNLTTRRYTEADIRRQVADGWHIWCISVADKFGDNGITGCIIVDGDRIDTLLLSCRILGKGIEDQFLKAVLNELRQSGCQRVMADYLPTAKNGQVADFYDRNGFALVEEEQDGAKHYAFTLKETPMPLNDKYTIKINK